MTVGGRSSRRELAAAIAMCAGGAALVLLAAGQPWTRAAVDLPPPLPTGRYALSGRELAPEVAALGVAGLAGLAGMVATRGLARVAVGAVVALIGAGAAVFAVLGIRDDHVRAELAARTSFGGAGSAVSVTTTPWWTVALAGGVLVLAAGLFTAVRGRRWARMSGRYDQPGPSRPAAEPPHDASAMWDSLDSGADPTADVTAERDAKNGKGS